MLVTEAKHQPGGWCMTTYLDHAGAIEHTQRRGEIMEVHTLCVETP